VRAGVVGVVAGLAVGAAAAQPALANPLATTGAVAFHSDRCEQGGVPMVGGPNPSANNCRASIFRVDADGSHLTRLTDGGDGQSGDWSPTWSPAGDQLAFSRQSADSKFRIVVMGADGSNQRLLLDDPPPTYMNMNEPSWSPTGALIAFEAYGAPPPGDPRNPFEHTIFVVAPDGSGLRALSPPGLTARSPAFAPDGLSVVYYAARSDDPNQEWSIYRTTLAGTTERLSLGDIGVFPSGLSFSADGLYLALELDDTRLYTMRLDGSDLVRRSEGVAAHAAWSPFGPTLFYTGPATEPYLSSVVFRLDLSESAPATALTAPAAHDQAAAWSALGAALPPVHAGDGLPPVVVNGTQLKVKRPDPIPFLALDRSGVRRVDAAVGRRAHGRCRFLDAKGKLGRSRSCARPVYARVKSAAGWHHRTRKLPHGSYVVRFRTVDARGNARRHPAAHVVSVR
jgi:Tol biopolymer transport system component